MDDEQVLPCHSAASQWSSAEIFMLPGLLPGFDRAFQDWGAASFQVTEAGGARP